ncbi:MAG: TRAP transporter small permease [Zestosphaera sp.]
MVNIRNVFNGIDAVLNIIEQSVVLVSGVALLTILIYSAVGRYLAGYGAPEEAELTWLFFLWLCFFGGSNLVREGDHPLLNILSDRISRSRRVGKAYKALTHTAPIVFAALLTYGIYKMYPIIAISITTMLRLPLTIYYAAALGGLAALTIRYLIKVVRTLSPG